MERIAWGLGGDGHGAGSHTQLLVVGPKVSGARTQASGNAQGQEAALMNIILHFFLMAPYPGTTRRCVEYVHGKRTRPLFMQSLPCAHRGESCPSPLCGRAGRRRRRKPLLLLVLWLSWSSLLPRHRPHCTPHAACAQQYCRQVSRVMHV